jgi:hypothetical protein
MTKEQILDKIAKVEKGLANPGLTEGARVNLKKVVQQLQSDLASMEKAVEKKEEKIDKVEEKAVENLDETIAKLEAQLKRNPPAAIKAVFEKKLAAAKEKRGDVIKEAKEDKKEAKEEIKEVKEAVKEIKKAVATGRTAPIKKPKIQEKKREEKSEKRVKKIKATTSSLQDLVNRVKGLKEKYIGRGVDLERDASRPAKPFGYRFRGKNDYRKPTQKQIEQGKKRGTIDYEARPNRSDKYPKGYKGSIREKLAAGGELMSKMKGGGNVMADGGEIRKIKGKNFSDQIENSRKFKELIKKVYDNQSEEKHPIEFITAIAKAKEPIVKHEGKNYIKGYSHKGTISHFDFLDDPNFVKALEYVDRPAIRKFEDGGMMREMYNDGSKVKKSKSKSTKSRKNSKNRFSWSNDAVKDGIIKKNKLNSTPSLYQRKKYPAYIIEK